MNNLFALEMLHCEVTVCWRVFKLQKNCSNFKSRYEIYEQTKQNLKKKHIFLVFKDFLNTKESKKSLIFHFWTLLFNFHVKLQQKYIFSS